MNRRYSDLRGRPSSKTTIEATTLVPWTWQTSKHSIRSGAVGQLQGVLELLQRLAAGGQVAGAGDLVPRQGLVGVALHRLHQRPLVAALRHPQVAPRRRAAR